MRLALHHSRTSIGSGESRNLPQLGPRTEERETFTRLLGRLLKGTEKGCE